MYPVSCLTLIQDTSVYVSCIMSCGNKIVSNYTSLYDSMRYNAIQCDTMRYNAIQCDTMRYNAIQCDTMRYNAIQCDTNGNVCYAELNPPGGSG